MTLKQKVASVVAECKKIGGLWVREIEEPTFHQKKWGLWVTAETISKNMGSLGGSSTENKGSLEPCIRVTSIMVVPPGSFYPKNFMSGTCKEYTFSFLPVVSR